MKHLDNIQLENFFLAVLTHGEETLAKARLSPEQAAYTVVIEADSGGSKGGNCYGGYSGTYRLDDEEIIDNITSSLAFYLQQLWPSGRYHALSEKAKEPVNKVSEKIAQEVFNSGNYEVHENSSDFYGNYTEERYYSYPVKRVIEELASVAIIADKATASSVQEKLSQQLHERYTVNDQQKRLTAIQQRLSTFNDTSQKKKAELEKALKQAQDKVQQLQSSLDKFTSTQDKERKSLLKEQKCLVESLGEKNMPAKPARQMKS